MLNKRYSITDLLRVMERLRDPQTGCPWDVRQNFESIVSSTLEECYELAHAIEQKDYSHMAEELGDVLFQVVFYAQLGSEQGLFEFDSVVETLVEKLLRRHPHVFKDGNIEGVVARDESIEAVRKNWESIKQSERKAKTLTGVLADIPHNLPALPRAQKLQKRAATVSFDWSGVSDVFAKLQEEVAELQDALEVGEASSVQEELGDVLFTTVNLARHLKLDAETTLRRSSSKFERRFKAMESLATADGASLEDLDSAHMDQLWEQVKASERLTSSS